MTTVVASPFSNAFSKNVNQNAPVIPQNPGVSSVIVIANAGTNPANTLTTPVATQLPDNAFSKSSLINNKGSIGQDTTGVTGPITTADYTDASALEFSNACDLNLEATIVLVVNSDGSQVLGFADEWSNTNEMFSQKQFINNVTIEDLANQDPNVIFNSITKQLFFQDSQVGASNLTSCTSSTSGIIPLIQITTNNALVQNATDVKNFGRIYDFQFKSINYGQNANANASICSSVANALGYVSFDKLLNDEVIRQNNANALHAACPSLNPPYNGFLVSPDYIAGGWINIDQLALNDLGVIIEDQALSIRTTPIIDAKRIMIKLLLNYTSSIVELNSQNKLTDFGIRIKDTTSGQIFDYQNIINGNIACVGNQIALTYDGTMQYGSATSGPATSTLVCNPCTQITQNTCANTIVQTASCVTVEAIQGVVHEIMPQICLNPLISVSGAPIGFLNTIDPIQWTTGIQNIPNYQVVFSDLIQEWGINNYNINHLNVPRAFHYAGGNSSQAYVCGGFYNSVINSLSTSTPNNFQNVNAWNLIGSNSVYYEISVPGGYEYNVTNAFTLYYEEDWNGNYWIVVNNTVIPTPKAMGIAGGGAGEEKILGFGVYNATFLNNGVVNTLYPTSQVWTTTNGLWSHLNNGNYARVCPAGFMKTTTVTSSGSMGSTGLCNTPTVTPSALFTADSNPSMFPNTPLQIDPITQLKIKDAMSKITNSDYTSSSQITTNAISNIGIVFNGWIGSGENSASTGLGGTGTDNDPFGLDRILDSEITNTFEYMQQTNVGFYTVSAELSGNNGIALDSSVNANVGWFLDTTRNYPLKTMGTLYLGTECSGVATGGKTGVSLNPASSINAVNNILYSYYNDSRYSEFNNSIVNLVYSYDGVAWTRMDNLSECVAFHTGVGDVNSQILYGGLHGSVENGDITVSFPGCDQWEQMIAAFGGTWHRKGTTGLDREKRYASFSTLYQDAFLDTYYKVGDVRDTTKSGILYTQAYLATGNVPDLSGVNWSTYVNATSGHITQIAYAGNNSLYPNLLDITYFMGGESWSSAAIKYEKLNDFNPILPYAERESALDDTDQVGFYTETVITTEANQYVESYKPDYDANPLDSADGISAFPVMGYFANKENFSSVVGLYKYAGHPTDAGMWLWSRPTAGEALFHPTNIHDNPDYYLDSCNVPHISGTWQTYESWIDQSFKDNIGLHSSICWTDAQDCLTLQDSEQEQLQGYANVTQTSRNYRWTVGDFRIKANRLSPGGKQIGCLDAVNVISDRELLYNLGYIGLCDLINGPSSNPTLVDGWSYTYLYAWDVNNNFSRVILCPVSEPIPHYVGYIDTGTSIEQIAITGVVTSLSAALTISPSANWANYFDYVYEVITSQSAPISGVTFTQGNPFDTGLSYPIQIDYNSNFWETNSIYSAYPVYTVNPTADFVGYNNKCFTPVDYFNQAWFLPSIPVSACCFGECNFLGSAPFVTGGYLEFLSIADTIVGDGCTTSDPTASEFLIEEIAEHSISYLQNILSNKQVAIPTSVCVTANGTYYGCASTSGCVYLNPCGLYIADCDCLTDGTSGDVRVFYHTGWFDDRADAIYGCAKPDGFQVLLTHESCENSCLTWWTSGCHIITDSLSGQGFYWVNANNAGYLFKDYGYYPNSFAISGCVSNTCSYGIKDTTVYWNFEMPSSADITRINHLRDFYDTLSFGLPQSYVKPTNFTYSFYITRDGVGLDQFFYSNSRNTFVERWKFPHSDVVLDTLQFNGADPYIVNNDGSGNFIPLQQSNLFKYGSMSVGEIEYPLFNTTLNGEVDGSAILNAIIIMSQVQADISSSSRTANYFNSGTNQTIASCSFDSLGNWLNITADNSLPEKYASHYYPMTYDNFNGPVTGGPYFLPRGIVHQSQFSIIPTANSSAIRDRAALWPWCDLLAGSATNKPSLGSATWYWDINGNIWTAECIDIIQVIPEFCFDQSANTDPLHRKLSPTTINAYYPQSYDREVYRIKCQDKHGNVIVDYKITYDEAAGPEIVGSKEGFDYNIFGTALRTRTIDLLNYNNKPLAGPTQTWVSPFDEANSIHAIDWRRTTLQGTSGCPIDLYPYNYGTVCEMLSGGYNRNNILNGLGYFCTIGSDSDTWIYSAPVGNTNIIFDNENFFIQESPFAISAIMQGSPSGMATDNITLIGSSFCIVDGFPPLTAICYDVSSAPSQCCYVPGPSGECLSFDIASASYEYSSQVCQLYLQTSYNINTYDTSGHLISSIPCVSSGLLPTYSVPLSATGFFSFGNPAPSGYVPPYEVLGWTACNQVYNSYGSEIVQSYRYPNGQVEAGLVSSAYITGPQSFGLGGLGLGKSTAMCGQLLYSGSRASCQYSQFVTTALEAVPPDSIISTAWPWNIIGFNGLLGPTGYTDAIDAEGNYWIAIGDVNNTNPYVDVDFVSFTQNAFKNLYTIIKIDVNKKSEFFNTVLARTNWKEVDGANFNGITCLSQFYNLLNENVRGTRFREGVLNALNLADGQNYYDIYVKIVQENNTNIYLNPVIEDKVNYEATTYIDSFSNEQISGVYTLPVQPLSFTPNITVIQGLDLVSQFDVNCTSCYINNASFVTDCPSASPWVQHNHEEWIAPYMESPFAGPYSQQGFNIWLTAGEDPRWGVALWTSISEGKVWANYRRQRLHVNDYRDHLVLAQLTAAVAIDDFASVSTSSYNLSGATAKVPVFVNYDEFIYCLDNYRDAQVVQKLLNDENANSSNGVECTDNIVASVNDSFLASVSGGPITETIDGAACNVSTNPCSAFNIQLLQNTNQGYVEWATSFIQQYASLTTSACAPNQKQFFKYNLNSNMDSNTYISLQCINSNNTIPTQWRRYQDGVGLGGDAPAFNLFDNNTEFTCQRLDQWFIGQTALGSVTNAIIVGGYAIAGDGELHASNCWWESNTFGVTFKWNTGVIQPEDTSNSNYQYRNFSPFFSSGENVGATSTMGVTVYDVSSTATVERQGSAKFETNITTFNVQFATPIPSYLTNATEYSISFVCSDNVKLWWSNKTASGFTINAETTFSGYVDWSIYLEGIIPGANVDALATQQTFEEFYEV